MNIVPYVIDFKKSKKIFEDVFCPRVGRKNKCPQWLDIALDIDIVRLNFSIKVCPQIQKLLPNKLQKFICFDGVFLWSICAVLD